MLRTLFLLTLVLAAFTAVSVNEVFAQSSTLSLTSNAALREVTLHEGQSGNFEYAFDDTDSSVVNYETTAAYGPLGSNPSLQATDGAFTVPVSASTGHGVDGACGTLDFGTSGVTCTRTSEDDGNVFTILATARSLDNAGVTVNTRTTFQLTLTVLDPDVYTCSNTLGLDVSLTVLDVLIGTDSDQFNIVVDQPVSSNHLFLTPNNLLPSNAVLRIIPSNTWLQVAAECSSSSPGVTYYAWSLTGTPTAASVGDTIYTIRDVISGTSHQFTVTVNALGTVFPHPAGYSPFVYIHNIDGENNAVEITIPAGGTLPVAYCIDALGNDLSSSTVYRDSHDLSVVGDYTTINTCQAALPGQGAIGTDSVIDVTTHVVEPISLEPSSPSLILHEGSSGSFGFTLSDDYGSAVTNYESVIPFGPLGSDVTVRAADGVFTIPVDANTDHGIDGACTAIDFGSTGITCARNIADDGNDFTIPVSAKSVDTNDDTVNTRSFDLTLTVRDPTSLIIQPLQILSRTLDEGQTGSFVFTLNDAGPTVTGYESTFYITPVGSNDVTTTAAANGVFSLDLTPRTGYGASTACDTISFSSSRVTCERNSTNDGNVFTMPVSARSVDVNGNTVHTMLFDLTLIVRDPSAAVPEIRPSSTLSATADEGGRANFAFTIYDGDSAVTGYEATVYIKPLLIVDIAQRNTDGEYSLGHTPSTGLGAFTACDTIDLSSSRVTCERNPTNDGNVFTIPVSVRSFDTNDNTVHTRSFDLTLIVRDPSTLLTIQPSSILSLTLDEGETGSFAFTLHDADSTVTRYEATYPLSLSDVPTEYIVGNGSFNPGVLALTGYGAPAACSTLNFGASTITCERNSADDGNVFTLPVSAKSLAGSSTVNTRSFELTFTVRDPTSLTIQPSSILSLTLDEGETGSFAFTLHDADSTVTRYEATYPLSLSDVPTEYIVGNGSFNPGVLALTGYGAPAACSTLNFGASTITCERNFANDGNVFTIPVSARSLAGSSTVHTSSFDLTLTVRDPASGFTIQPSSTTLSATVNEGETTSFAFTLYDDGSDVTGYESTFYVTPLASNDVTTKNTNGEFSIGLTPRTGYGALAACDTIDLTSSRITCERNSTNDGNVFTIPVSTRSFDTNGHTVRHMSFDLKLTVRDSGSAPPTPTIPNTCSNTLGQGVALTDLTVELGTDAYNGQYNIVVDQPININHLFLLVHNSVPSNANLVLDPSNTWLELVVECNDGQSSGDTFNLWSLAGTPTSASVGTQTYTVRDTVTNISAEFTIEVHASGTVFPHPVSYNPRVAVHNINGENVNVMITIPVGGTLPVAYCIDTLGNDLSSSTAYIGNYDLNVVGNYHISNMCDAAPPGEGTAISRKQFDVDLRVEAADLPVPSFSLENADNIVIAVGEDISSLSPPVTFTPVCHVTSCDPLELAFSDPASVPAWLSLTKETDGTWRLTGTPTASDVGSDIRVGVESVSYPGGFVRYLEFDVELIAISSFSLENTDDRVIVVGEDISSLSPPVTFTPVCHVLSCDPLELTFSSGEPAPAWLSLTKETDGTWRLTGTPTASDVGSDIRVGVESVSYPGGFVRYLEFDVVTQAPAFVLENADDRVVAVGQNIDSLGPPITITLVCDISCDPLELTFSSGEPAPAWLSLVKRSDGTWYFEGTPTASDVGSDIRVGVEFVNIFVDYLEFDVELIAISSFSLENVDDIVITVGQDISSLSPPVTFTPVCHVLSCDPLELAFSDPASAPAWLSLTKETDGTWYFEGTPTASDVGSDIRVKVESVGYPGGFTKYLDFDVVTQARSDGDKKKRGSSDSDDWKLRPTFGKSWSATSAQLVKDGFSLNGHTIDITNNWHTDFLLTSSVIGEQNTVTMKAYTTDGLRSAQLYLGVPEVGDRTNAEVGIIVNLQRNHTNTAAGYDIVSIQHEQDEPLVNVNETSATISNVHCTPSDDKSSCSEVTLNFTIMAPLTDEVLAISAVDAQRRSTVTYINEGVEFVGESLLDPATAKLFVKNTSQEPGSYITLTQEDRRYEVWRDQDGYLWTQNGYGTWMQLTRPDSLARSDDPSMTIKTRVHSDFAKLVEYEQDKAKLVFDADTLISIPDESFAYEIPVKMDKKHDPVLLEKMSIEEVLALEKALSKYIDYYKWYAGDR